MIRRILGAVRRTPLHPQWLISRERAVFRKALDGLRGQVADIGCGDRWVEHCLGGGATYIGVDNVLVGRDIYRSKPSVFADATCLPFADRSLNAVVMFEVIEHLPDPARAISEAWRCMDVGGKIIVSVPFIYPIHDAPVDYQRYTRHGLELLLARHGFEDVQITPRLSSVQTAALTACLVMAGQAYQAVSKRNWRVLLLPLWALLVPVVNIVAVLIRPLEMPWEAVTNGYVAVAVKSPGGRES